MCDMCVFLLLLLFIRAALAKFVMDFDESIWNFCTKRVLSHQRENAPRGTHSNSIEPYRDRWTINKYASDARAPIRIKLKRIKCIVSRILKEGERKNARIEIKNQSLNAYISTWCAGINNGHALHYEFVRSSCFCLLCFSTFRAKCVFHLSFNTESRINFLIHCN